MGLSGFGYSGASPSPFDALDGRYLAGPQGSHPLHDVDAAMLLRPARGPIEGTIELDAPSTTTAALRLDAVRAGGSPVSLALPEGLAPSFDGAGLEVAYVVRVVVDRPFQPDAVIERPVGLA